MTAVADLISLADRDRLLKRLDEWRELADAMRRPGGMPAVPEPPALHQMAGRGGVGHHHRRPPGTAGRQQGRNTMTEPRTFEFEARLADGGGNTGIEVSPQRSPGGTEVWINVGGNTAEVLISPREAVKLAHALLTIAAPAAGTVKQFVTGASFMGSDPSPARTIWLLDAEPLT